MSAVASSSKMLLPALCRSNLGILRQKLDLMQLLTTRFGRTEACVLYQQVCPIVQASIGQHIRHSMDHLELAASQLQKNNHNNNIDKLQYDVRQRGGTDEYDMDEAEQRILRVVTLLEDAAATTTVEDVGTSNPQQEEKEESDGDGSSVLALRPIQACFILSGDDPDDIFELPSTVGRELGFAAHHAIHHLALVKLIATGDTVGLSVDDLPSDFGRAPSTIVFDRHQT